MNTKLIELAFSRYYRKEFFTLEDAIEFLWERNLINVGELAEHAIVHNNKNLTQNSRNTKGSDFNDGSDSKYITVSHYITPAGYQSTYASVGGIKNKTGTLRICCYEPKTKETYFFLVPHKVYAPYTKGNDSLKIYFDKDGNPRNATRSDRRYNLWDYECSAREWATAK